MKMLDANEIQILDFNAKPEAAESCTLFVGVKILCVKWKPLLKYVHHFYSRSLFAERSLYSTRFAILALGPSYLLLNLFETNKIQYSGERERIILLWVPSINLPIQNMQIYT